MTERGAKNTKNESLKFIAAVIIFGSNGILASYIHLNSWEIVFFRTMLGSIVLLAAFLLRGQRFTLKEKKKDALLQIISGVSNAACWICLYEGYQLIGVNIPTLLSYGGSVLVMVLSPLLFREKLTWARCAGFLSVIVGDVLLTGGLNSSEQGTKGILYGILAGVFFSVLIICNKKARIEGFEKATLQMLFCFFTVAIFVLCKQGIYFRVQAVDWLPILLLGVVNTGFASLLYFSAMGKLPAQTTAVLGYIEPLSALVFSALFLKERMSGAQLVGAILILSGVILAELWGPFTNKNRRRKGGTR